MGKQISFTYKGSDTHGTAVGGYVSMIVSIIIWVLALGEIYACFWVPDESQILAFHQLDIPNDVVHTVQAQQGFPAFLVQT